MSTMQEIQNSDIDIYRRHNLGPLLAGVVLGKLREKGNAWLFAAKDNRNDGRAPELDTIIQLSMPHRGVLRYSDGMESTIAGSLDTPSEPLTEKHLLCVIAYQLGRLGPWVFNLDEPPKVKAATV